MRGAEETINEDTESSCAFGQGQTLARKKDYAHAGTTRTDFDASFLSGDEVARGCPPKTKSFSVRVGSRCEEGLFLTICKLRRFFLLTLTLEIKFLLPARRLIRVLIHAAGADLEVI